jgi:hypothetical protein
VRGCGLDARYVAGASACFTISMEEWRVGTAMISGTPHSASAALRESF